VKRRASPTAPAGQSRLLRRPVAPGNDMKAGSQSWRRSSAAKQSRVWRQRTGCRNIS